MVAIVYMVAGMSSRFGGRPKQMAKVGPDNETLIEFSVNQALKQNFSKLVYDGWKHHKLIFDSVRFPLSVQRKCLKIRYAEFLVNFSSGLNS